MYKMAFPIFPFVYPRWQAAANATRAMGGSVREAAAASALAAGEAARDAGWSGQAVRHTRHVALTSHPAVNATWRSSFHFLSKYSIIQYKCNINII